MHYLIARVSDPEQRKALPAQTKRLKDYAAKLSWAENKDYKYIEFDETAYKDDRKKFRELVIDPLSEEKELVIVVFDKIDRFSRDSSSEERAALTKLFRQGKIEMHFPSDNLFIHKNSPAADLFRLDIGVALAGYYSSAIRDNVKRKFEKKLADGEWPGKAPIGYVNYDKDGGYKGDPIKDIKPDPQRDYHILEGFKLRSTGVSYKVVAKDRKKAGLVSNTKLKKPITSGQWEDIFQNPFYYGKMRYMSELYPHNYGAIVPKWLWDKCQEVRQMRSNHHTQFNKAKPFIFKNLKCATCGYSITFDGPKHNGRTYAKCTEWAGKHGAKWVDEQILLAQMKETFKAIQVPKELLPEIVAEIEKNHASEQEHYKTTKARLIKDHKELDEEVKALFRDRNRFNLRPELFEEMVQEIETKQKDITEQLEAHTSGDKAFVIGASYILDVCSRAVELFEAESSKVEQKRYLIDFIVSNMKLDGEKLVFNLKEPFDAIAGLSKTKNWLRGLGSNQRPSR